VPMETVGAIMSSNLVTVDGGTLLAEAARTMHERRVGAALVFADERLAGILTERDILRAVAEAQLEATTVGAWMTRNPETIDADETAGQAAAVMIHGGFRHLPVTDESGVVGIVSIRDLVRVVIDDVAPRGV